MLHTIVYLLCFAVSLFQNLSGSDHFDVHAVLYVPSSAPPPTHATCYHHNHADYTISFSEARKLPSQIRYKALSPYTKEVSSLSCYVDR